MAKIVGGPNGPVLRDEKGEHTGFAFTTKHNEIVWVSDKSFRNVCVSIVLVIAMVTGTVETGFAIPDKLINWVLRGPLK